MPCFVVALIALGLCAGCSKPSTPLEIQFAVYFDGQPLACETPAERALLTDLRFFVYDLELTVGDNRRAVELSDDGRWQDGQVALIDLENGLGACLNGDSPVNRSVLGTVAGRGAPEQHGLRFTIGVPEALNHANPVVAPAPRNGTIMHWHWRSGYKFMRAGIETPEDRAWLHLGSARCEGSIADIQGCASSNRPVVHLPRFDPARDTVVIDLARLFGPTRLDDGQPWSCESGPGEAQCGAAFAELGIDFRSGNSIGPAPAFYATRAP